MWYLYIVQCSDGSLYTGITKDVERRLAEHNYIAKAAKYTRARRPVSLVCSYEAGDSRSDAMKEEIRVKKMTRAQKLKWIAVTNSV